MKTQKTKMTKDGLLAKLFHICKQQKRVSKKKVCIFSRNPSHCAWVTDPLRPLKPTTQKNTTKINTIWQYMGKKK